jgi:hypothetical protein
MHGNKETGRSSTMMGMTHDNRFPSENTEPIEIDINKNTQHMKTPRNDYNTESLLESAEQVEKDSLLLPKEDGIRDFTGKAHITGSTVRD